MGSNMIPCSKKGQTMHSVSVSVVSMRNPASHGGGVIRLFGFQRAVTVASSDQLGFPAKRSARTR
jgi:hypothetical protein